MLSTLRSALLPLVLGLAFLFATASPAISETCVEEVNDWGNVIVTCYDDGSAPGGGSDGGGSNAGDDGGRGSTAACVTTAGTEVPCVTDLGTWTGTCYARIADPQPDLDHPAWEGNEDGYIIECTATTPDGSITATAYYWAPAPPGAIADPRQLAAEAVAAMNLTMGEIGTAPPSIDADPDAMALVGLPIWLWIANPAENTTGPITRSASEGSVSVTATATLERIEYTLSPRVGSVSVTCAGDNIAGTAYVEAYGEQDPPCGFTAAQNVRMGEPAVITGTAYWVVEWSGGGQTGRIDVPPQTSTTQINIGELQVLRTG